ncbi:hypothetical protein PSENEW3n2_00000783 [Picochlorum sp. SENEW3]|nr:hypothetical protein PSENEW3n2_00000783 [Picochlorum sp. SENEW3]WPT15704.1 hypothetical protein PSENEW3_00000783 [Picochlorum sp. SENEW3]
MVFVHYKALDTFSAAERELPVYKSLRTRQSRQQLDLLESILRRVGKIQSVIFCIGLPVLAILSAVGVVRELEWDFVSLVLIGFTGFASLKAFPEGGAVGSSKSHPLCIKAAALLLQICFIACQVVIRTPLTKITSILLSIESSSLVVKIAPVSVMVGFASLLHCIQKFTGRSANRPLSLTKDALREQTLVGDDSSLWSGVRLDRVASEEELSPFCSYSSTSSGDLSSGLPSPTGFCDDRDTGKDGLVEAYRAATSKKLEGNDDTVYLLKFDSGHGESYYFVHKKLRPIKTKLESVQQQGNYRPLLRTLIQRSKEKHIPAVRSVANEKIDGVRMLPCPTAR